MSLWNPYAGFSVTGQALPQVSPPELRVLGGTPTAQQRVWIQEAFYKFAMHARLSAVPNPTEQGFIQDGSRYTIQVLGPQTIVTLWLNEPEELRLSGIAIYLVNLDGSLIEAHSKDGLPIGYLLTPTEVKGTRRSTGKWRVRKPTTLLGGKAVNAGIGGKRYFTGVQGETNLNVSIFRPWQYGVNGIAYIDDLPAEGPVFEKTKQVGKSRDQPLPFVYDSNGVKRAMQIIVRAEGVLPSIVYHLDLYAGPLNNEPSDFIGDLVYTTTVPGGGSIQSRSLTFSEDGTQAKAVGTQSGNAAFFTVNISPEALSLTVDRTFPSSSVSSGLAYYESRRNVNVGTPGEAGYSDQTWTIFGMVDGDHEYGSTFSVYGPTGEVGAEWLGTGKQVFAGAEFPAFDRRGKLSAGNSRESGTSWDNYKQNYGFVGYESYPTPTNPDATSIRNEIVDEYRYETRRFSSAGNHVTFKTHETKRLQSLYVPDDDIGYHFQFSNTSGDGAYFKDNGYKSQIFYDEELQFSIYYDVVSSIQYTWTWTGNVDTGPVQNLSPVTTTDSQTLNITCKGVQILRKTVDLGDGYRHMALLASDPMTGALLVNVQEVHEGSRVPRASWIYLVDDSGVRELGTVLDLPPNAKALNNAAIFSV